MEILALSSYSKSKFKKSYMYVFMCKEYDSVIKDQIERGIVEVVNEETKPDVVQYIPYNAVIRRDKSITR